MERLVGRTRQRSHDDALGLSDDVAGFQRVANHLQLVGMQIISTMQLLHMELVAALRFGDVLLVAAFHLGGVPLLGFESACEHLDDVVPQR